MRGNTKRALIGLLTMAMLGTGFVGSAAAAAGDPAGHFTCRASALRITAPVVGTLEPVTANPQNDPCESESNNLLTLPTPLGTVSLLNAATEAEKRAAQATASLVDANLLIPVGEGQSVQIQVAQATARAECQVNPQGRPTAQRPEFSSSSSVLFLAINGQEFVNVNEPQVIEIPGVGTVAFNQTTQQSTERGPKPEENVQRAVEINIPAAGVNVVIGEAMVDFTGQPCAPGLTK